MKSSNQKETIIDDQLVVDKEKMKKIFSAIDIENPPAICPIRDVLSHALDKWSILIILMLGYYDILRFAELKRKVSGVSPKMLSKSLRSLEQDGFLERTVFPQVPIRVEYKLTQQGKSFLERILDLSEWINVYMSSIVKKRYGIERVMKQLSH